MEAASEDMTAIELDPASHSQANVTVKAARYFTADDDGLKQVWSGRVFLNAPGGFVPKELDGAHPRNGSSSDRTGGLDRRFPEAATDAAELCDDPARFPYLHHVEAHTGSSRTQPGGRTTRRIDAENDVPAHQEQR